MPPDPPLLILCPGVKLSCPPVQNLNEPPASIFQCHSFQQDIDSESEEEDVVGASFDWTGDSTLTLDVSSNFQIY